MAIVKQKVEKKSEKKPAKKAVAVKNVKPTSFIIKVPQGGQIIQTFNLTPSLPLDGKAANWLVIDPSAKKPVDIDKVYVSFSPKSSITEQYFERAVLIVNMQQNPADKGTWRFVSKGVVVNGKTPDGDHDFLVDVIDQGMTLVVYVHVVGDAPEKVNFSYIASFTDATSGEVKVYESQDPGIGSGRP